MNQEYYVGINTNGWRQKGNAGTQKNTKKTTTLRWTPEIVHDFKSAGATISDVTCQYYVRVG